MFAATLLKRGCLQASDGEIRSLENSQRKLRPLARVSDK
jgi:hypothetical protein